MRVPAVSVAHDGSREGLPSKRIFPLCRCQQGNWGTPWETGVPKKAFRHESQQRQRQAEDEWYETQMGRWGPGWRLCAQRCFGEQTSDGWSKVGLFLLLRLFSFPISSLRFLIICFRSSTLFLYHLYFLPPFFHRPNFFPLSHLLPLKLLFPHFLLFIPF